MQFNVLAVFVAATFGTTVFAQDFSQVPPCAFAPALQVFGKTGCSQTDMKCICSSKQHIPELHSEVDKVCSDQDLAKAAKFATDMCKKAGIDIHF